MRIAMICSPVEPSSEFLADQDQAMDRYLEGLSTALARCGHDVRVYLRRQGGSRQPHDWSGSRRGARPAATDGPDGRWPGVRVVRAAPEPATPPGDEESLRRVGQFGRWVGASWRGQAWAPEVVHAHSWLGGLAALTARGEASLPVPVVLSYHSLDQARRHPVGAEGGTNRRLAYERVLGRQVDLVIAGSSAQVEELARLGVPRQAVSLVVPAVDLDRFTPVGPAALAPGGKRILAFGYPSGGGLADVVHAVRAIPDAELIVIDQPSGPHGDAPDPAPALRRLAGSDGVGDRVRLVRGVAREALPAWYRSGDLLAWPSRRWDLLGQAPVEAMACGLPVVGYGVAALLDTVVDGVTGVVVPWRNARAFTVAMRDLLRDAGRRWAIGAAAADRARHCYSWSRSVAQVLSAYRRVAGERPSVAATS